MDVAEKETKTRSDVDLTDAGQSTRGRYGDMAAPTRRSAGVWILGILAGIMLVIGITLGIGKLAPKAALPGLQKDKYQSLFLTNGQVYFGKLRATTGSNYKITDIYYLQTQSQPPASTDAKNQQQQAQQQQNIQLVKLGNEIHGPQDEMVIPKAQVLFWENLKTDGKVAQAIQQEKKQTK